MDTKEIFNVCKNLINALDFENLAENIIILDDDDYIGVLKSKLNTELERACHSIKIKANSLLKLDEHELNKLKDSIEKIKRANSLLRHFIDEQEALRLNEIDNEVGKIIKKLLFEVSNPKDVIDFSEKMSNRELLCFLIGPEIFNEIKKLEISNKNSDLITLNLPKISLNTEKINNNNLKKNEKYILISGSADDKAKKLLYEYLFQIKYDSSIQQIEYNQYKIIEQTNLNRLSFDRTLFRNRCNEIRSNLKAIICLENLNPRPETLLNDITILSECFNPNELKEKIFFVFTFSNGSKSSTELRDDILKFDTLFDYLTVSSKEKYDFVIDKIWALGKVELQMMTESFHNFLNSNSSNFLNTRTEKIISSKLKKSLRKFVIVGPMGYGKSTTGNKLCGDDCFTVGNDISRITKSIKFQKTNADLTVIDCPGFGDPTDETIFFAEFLKKKQYFLEIVPIDAFILVIKFDQDKSGSFLDAAKHYVKAFGTEGIKSMMLLCIQGSEKRRYAKDDFKSIILNSDGYLYLVKKNENIQIPYCLWDNFREYTNQEKNFEECLNKLKPFTMLHMKYAMDNIDNIVLVLNKEKYERAEIKKRRNSYLKVLELQKEIYERAKVFVDDTQDLANKAKIRADNAEILFKRKHIDETDFRRKILAIFSFDIDRQHLKY